MSGVRALTGQPRTVARFAAALTTIRDLAESGLIIVLIGLKWFCMEMGMSVAVRGYGAVLGEYSVRRCWRSQPIKGSVRG
jgi:hypothetical protein